MNPVEAALTRALDHVLDFSARGGRVRVQERLDKWHAVAIHVRVRGEKENWECAHLVEMERMLELGLDTALLCAGKCFMRRDWSDIKTYSMDFVHGNGD